MRARAERTGRAPMPPRIGQSRAAVIRAARPRSVERGVQARAEGLQHRDARDALVVGGLVEDLAAPPGISGAKGLFFATGHGPSGIAPAPASAELLADLVTGQTPKVPTAPFDPLRFVGVDMPDPRTWGVRGGLPI